MAEERVQSAVGMIVPGSEMREISGRNQNSKQAERLVFTVYRLSGCFTLIDVI